MLNEKKIMEQKLFLYTMLAICAGFLLGVVCVILLLLFTVRMSAYAGIVATLMLLVTAYFGMLANKVYQQLREFINRPYVGDLEEED